VLLGHVQVVRGDKVEPVLVRLVVYVLELLEDLVAVLAFVALLAS
jgi:hypothetical protein